MPTTFNINNKEENSKYTLNLPKITITISHTKSKMKIQSARSILQEINALELRIMDAIDSGYLIDEHGVKVNIYTPEGFNMLGNVIEGNVDSCNTRFYGMYDALARDILGFNYDFYNKNKVIPSVLQCYSTNMRDPAFYMLYRRIMTYFLRYKKFQPQYSQSELQVLGVNFKSVNIDKLYTYFNNCDTLINNAVPVNSFKAGMNLRLTARRSCLRYKPFTYKINIDFENKELKGMMRVFLGPAFDDVQQDIVYLQKYYYYFVEMDRFIVDLHPGMNSIKRHSSQSPFTATEMVPSDIFYDKLNRAISGKELFTYSDRIFGFPERFTLPRGKPEGLRYKMFFFLSSLEETNMIMYEMPLYGKIMSDGQSFGFPLDRPMFAWNYTIPNMFFKDVYIYHGPQEKNEK